VTEGRLVHVVDGRVDWMLVRGVLVARVGVAGREVIAGRVGAGCLVTVLGLVLVTGLETGATVRVTGCGFGRLTETAGVDLGAAGFCTGGVNFDGVGWRMLLLGTAGCSSLFLSPVLLRTTTAVSPRRGNNRDPRPVAAPMKLPRPTSLTPAQAVSAMQRAARAKTTVAAIMVLIGLSS
jgi:hypothetical protein